MKRSILLVVFGVGLGCGSSKSDTDRYVNEEQGYSVEQPNGWGASLVRGLAQFEPKASGMRSHHTMVIRGTDKPRELVEGKPTSAQEVYAATETVLRTLPRANFGATTTLRDGELSGTRFSLTFVPTGTDSTYHREHVVLVGTKHVYHVIYTAPAGEPIDEAALKRVATTLTEGV